MCVRSTATSSVQKWPFKFSFLSGQQPANDEQNSGSHEMWETSFLAHYPISSLTRSLQNQFIKLFIQRVSNMWHYTLQYTTYGPYSLEVLWMNNTNKHANKIHHIYHTIYLSSSIQGQVTWQLWAAGNERSTQAIRQRSRALRVLYVTTTSYIYTPSAIRHSMSYWKHHYNEHHKR